MFIVKYKSIFISISILLVIASFFAMGKFGIKKGIDFTGGTVIETSYLNTHPESLDKKAFSYVGVDVYQTNPTSYKFISTLGYDEMTKAIQPLIAQKMYPYMETNVTSVGPTLGAEMTKKAIIAIIVVVFVILFFIAFAFRHVSLPVSSWKYGTVAMVTLIHDITIPTGIYVWLSQTQGAQVDTLFVIALLTILGISISDKIVVFDRIRENLRLNGKRAFAETVGISLKQTFTRSINTSVTVVLALIALYIFGPTSTKFFALTLISGMIIGTYSSIFVASPLLIVWNKKK